MDVLNLFPGIGGNRMLWDNVNVIAVENNLTTAQIYQDKYPGDLVILADAYKFLLDNYTASDFIWASPSCFTHSKLKIAAIKSGKHSPQYPDFKLWQLIRFLQLYSKVPFVVENVVTGYDPIIKPTIRLGRHFIWTNFPVPFRYFPEHEKIDTIKRTSTRYGVELKEYYSTVRKDTLLRNMVDPAIGKYLLDLAFDRKQTIIQTELF